MSLKPINIVQAAEADLKRRARNKERHTLAKQGLTIRGYHPEIETYAFLAHHVRRATNVGHLIELAMLNSVPKTTKKNTILIYGDIELLANALCIFHNRVSRDLQHGSDVMSPS